MKLIEISASQFEEITSINKENCLVVFSREGCTVCTELIPEIEKAADECKEKFGFYYVNVKSEDGTGLALFKNLKLVGVPQTLFYYEGELKETLPGGYDKSQILKEINRLFNPGVLAKIRGLFSKKN